MIMLWYKLMLYLQSLSNVFDSTFQKEHTGLEKDKKMFTVAFCLFIRKDSRDHEFRILPPEDGLRAGSRETVKDLFKKKPKNGKIDNL